MPVSLGTGFPSLTLEVNFSGSTWTDISTYVRSVDTDRPSSEETGRYPAGSATIVLDNRDGRFTPANLSGPYVSGGVTQVLPDIGVRLRATWSSTDYNLFCGVVENWQDEFPEFGYDAVTVLTVVDRSALVAAWNGTAVGLVGEGERSGARIGRILDAASFPASMRSLETGDEPLQATDLDGNGLDQIHNVVDSEGGACWYEPLVVGLDGGFRFIGRGTRVTATRHTTAQATFAAANVRFRDPVVSSGRERVVRAASFQRAGSPFPQGAGSGVPRVTRSGLLVQTDEAARQLAELTVALGSPADSYRVRAVTVDPIADGSWATVLGLRMQDRCAVTVAPPVSGLSISRNVFVDGIAHSIRPGTQWSITFQFQSATAWAAFAGAAWDSGLWDAARWFF